MEIKNLNLKSVKWECRIFEMILGDAGHGKSKKMESR